MWIRMIATAAGPRLPHPLVSEQTYQVEDDLGRELIEARAAKQVGDPSPKAQEHPTELAAVDDGKKAIERDSEKKPNTLMDRLKEPAESKAAKK